MTGVAELLSSPFSGSACSGIDECAAHLECDLTPVQLGTDLAAPETALSLSCATGARYGSLVNVHGVVIDRQTRSSDHHRWYEPPALPTIVCYSSCLGSVFASMCYFTRGATGLGTGQEAWEKRSCWRLERLVGAYETDQFTKKSHQYSET